MQEEGTRNLWKSVLWTIFSPGSCFQSTGVLALCSPSVALEKAPGGWLQAGSQGPAEILLHSGSSSWPRNGCALSLSPGNSYSLISSWNTTPVLPDRVLGTLFPSDSQFLKAGSTCYYLVGKYLSWSPAQSRCTTNMLNWSKISLLNFIRPSPTWVLCTANSKCETYAWFFPLLLISVHVT